MVMVIFYPDLPGFSGTDHLGFIGVMLGLGGFAYGIPVIIIGDAPLAFSIVYLICYTIAYIIVLIYISRAGGY
jgi:hypothetical protein